jgi:hypothetical protein
MAMATRDLECLSRRIAEYHSSKDATGVVEDLDELDIGDGVVPWPTYVSAHLNMSQKMK